MRRAAPDESLIEKQPILMANVSPTEFSRLCPIEMSEIDPFAAAEPSIGAMAQLDNGQYMLIIYGKISGTLMVYVPPTKNDAVTLEKVLEEVSLKPEHIQWRRDRDESPIID